MALLDLTWLMSQFLVKVFAILGLTRLHLVYFSANSSVIFTQLILGLGSLKSSLHTLRVLKTFIINFLSYTWLNLTNLLNNLLSLSWLNLGLFLCGGVQIVISSPLPGIV